MALRDTCWLAAYSALVFLSFLCSTSASEKTLVLIDNANTKETHSIFFNSLKGKASIYSLAFVLLQTVEEHL